MRPWFKGKFMNSRLHSHSNKTIPGKFRILQKKKKKLIIIIITYQNDKSRRNAAKNRILGKAAKKKFAQFKYFNQALNMGIYSVIESEDIPMRIKPQEFDQHGQPLHVAKRVNTK